MIEYLSLLALDLLWWVVWKKVDRPLEYTAIYKKFVEFRLAGLFVEPIEFSVGDLLHELAARSVQAGQLFLQGAKPPLVICVLRCAEPSCTVFPAN